MTAFGRLPTNPFTNNLDNNNGSRNPPFYEFKGERLHDTFDSNDNPTASPCYHDSLGTDRPFAYFSAYGTEGYDLTPMTGDPRGGRQGGDDYVHAALPGQGPRAEVCGER